MKTPTPLRLLAHSLLLTSLVVAQPAPAADEAQEPVDLVELRAERKAKAKRYSMRQRISKRHRAADEARAEEDLEGAIRLLEKLEGKKMNPYEAAMTYRLRGFVAYEAEDAATAIRYFELAIEQEALSVESDSKLRFYVAQLNATLERWPECIAAVQEWLRYEENPKPLGFFLLGMANYHAGDLDAARVAAQRAVDEAPEPKEGWLQLLSAIHLQRVDYPAAQSVLEELVTEFPKKTYWVQLSTIYGLREEYRESLGVQQIAYAQDLLTEDGELRRLARSLLYHSLPYDAALVLEKGLAEDRIETDFESLEMLGNSWIAAREYGRAAEPLMRAADLSEDGAIFVRLSQVHMQREQWRDAAELLQRAIDKGGLEDPGNAQLLLGISYYSDEQIERARSSFQRATRHPTASEEAHAWLMHVEREIEQAERNGSAPQSPGAGGSIDTAHAGSTQPDS